MQPPQMSFLGVGAPEALLVGVVALIVFGPKGLAEAAKSKSSVTPDVPLGTKIHIKFATWQ
jgi:hypothetical protein